MFKKFIDIGANLTDPMYEGLYRGSRKHQADLKNVLERAWLTGLDKIIITGGSLEESQSAHKLALSDETFTPVKSHETVKAACAPPVCSPPSIGDAVALEASPTAELSL